MSARCRYRSSLRRLPTSIRRPRREWWSLRCSRRCWVRSLMRAVSSATWTSVDPVSESARPYLETMSRFASAVSVIRRKTVAGGSCLLSAGLLVLPAAPGLGRRLDLGGCGELCTHLGTEVASPLTRPYPAPARPAQPSTRRGTAGLRSRRRKPRRLADLARLDDVPLHLLDQRVHRLEALLSPHALDERDAEVLAVQVAVEADQVGLDEEATAGLERRADPHVHGRRIPVCPGGVDAVPGTDERVVGHDVRGRDPELAPAAVAHYHLAFEQERAAQELGRVAHVTCQNEPTNVARGDRLAGPLHERHHPRLELRPGAEELGRALRALAEAEVLAHGHALCAEPAGQHVDGELLRAERRELAVERDHDELLDAETGDQVALDVERRDQLGGRLRVQDRERMGLECEDRVAAADDLAVAQMDAVEGADRDVARTGAGLDLGKLGDLHRGANTTTGWSSRPRSSPTASTSPSRVRRTGPPSTAAAATRRPCLTAAASSSVRCRSGRKESASLTGTSRSGSASSRRNGPIAVRSSSSQ